MFFPAAGCFARRLEGAFVRYRNCGMTLEIGALGQATLRYLHAFGSLNVIPHRPAHKTKTECAEMLQEVVSVGYVNGN